MGNQHRGVVDIEIGGRQRRLRFTMNALVEIQDRLQLRGMSQIMAALQDMDFRTLRTLLWAGLVRDGRELTEEEVGEWAFDVGEVAQKVANALVAAFGKPPADQGNVKGPAASGTGAKP